MSHSQTVSITNSGAPRGLGGGGGGAGQIQKVGPSNIDCVGGLHGGTPPGNFEILHALKCVLEAPETLFCACT